jgi:sugar lactone lactonase YvrE
MVKKWPARASSEVRLKKQNQIAPTPARRLAVFGVLVSSLALIAAPFAALISAPIASATSGYSAEYWNLPGGSLDKPPFPSGAPDLTRTDPDVDFNWGAASPDPSITAGNFAARWTKTAGFNAGNYVFTVRSSDGARVYVDGALVLDEWYDQPTPSVHAASKALTAGNHAVKVEYYEHSGSAAIHFSYAPEFDASGLLGQANYSANGGDAAGPNPSGLSNPATTALDATGHHLYVSDSQNNRVLMFNLTASNTLASTSAAVVFGERDMYTSFCPSESTSGSFCNPGGIALDTVNHHLFVADTNSGRVLEFNLTAGNTPADTTADYVFGKPDFGSVGGCSTSADDLCSPESVAVDPDNHVLYVADSSSHRVVGYNLASDNTPADTSADYVFGQTSVGAQAQSDAIDGLRAPKYVTLDVTGHHLIVSDTGNYRVLYYDLTAANVPATAIGAAATALIGQTNYGLHLCNSGLSATASNMCAPMQSALDPVNHRLFVMDATDLRTTVYALAADNTPTTNKGEAATYVIGQPNLTTSSSCSASATEYCFNYAQGLTLDPTGHHLYVSDRGNNRVILYNLNSSNLVDGTTTEAVLGQSSPTAAYVPTASPPPTIIASTSLQPPRSIPPITACTSPTRATGACSCITWPPTTPSPPPPPQPSSECLIIPALLPAPTPPPRLAMPMGWRSTLPATIYTSPPPVSPASSCTTSRPPTLR